MLSTMTEDSSQERTERDVMVGGRGGGRGRGKGCALYWLLAEQPENLPCRFTYIYIYIYCVCVVCVEVEPDSALLFLPAYFPRVKPVFAPFPPSLSSFPRLFADHDGFRAIFSISLSPLCRCPGFAFYGRPIGQSLKSSVRCRR